MAGKKDSDATAAAANPFAQMQAPGLEQMKAYGTAWVEAMGDMTAEYANFIATRIQDDVDTQKAMMRCKSVEEFQHLQTEFLKRMAEQYKAETGKLAEIGMRAFDPTAVKKDKAAE